MAATLGCIGGLAIGAFFLLGHKLTQDEPDVVLVQPAVSIDMLKTERSADVSAMHLRDALIVALARFQTLRILSSTDDGEERQRPGQAKYRVALKYGKDSFGQQLWWQVIDLDGGEILNSGVERIVPGNQDWADPANPVIANLATRLAGDTGIINRAEASAADGAALGNGCIVQAYLAVELADRAALDASRSCLRRTIELRPRDADAKAAMAVALLEPAPSAVPPSIRSQALDLAEQSAMAEPYSSASAYAQMLARYSTGNLDGAIASGQRALVINPYDMKTAAKLGRILTLAGRQDEAVPLLAEASKGEGRAAADAVAMLAFDSYRRGAYDEALRRLQQSAIKDCYVLRMLEIATLGQSGRKADADQVIESTRQSRPDFETGFSAAMKSYSVAPPVASALEEGLKTAGLDPQ
jgi:tetratricopeptide (TPR) repeat protein